MRRLIPAFFLVAALLVSGTPAGAAQTTEPAGLAEELNWVAIKEQTLVPPPGVPPVEIGVMIDGALSVDGVCTEVDCEYQSSVDLWPLGEHVPSQPGNWVRDGSTWSVQLDGHHLSARYPNGIECVILRTEIWTLETNEAVFDGNRLVATNLVGTFERTDTLDPAYSAAGIAQEYCPPYTGSDLWSVTATSNVTEPAVVTDTATTSTTAAPSSTTTAAASPVVPIAPDVATTDDGGELPWILILTVVFLLILGGGFVRLARDPDDPKPEPDDPRDGEPTPIIGEEVDEHGERCDWVMNLVDRSEPDSPVVLQVLKEARPGATPCCVYEVGIHTTVAAATSDHYDRTSWFTSHELHNARASVGLVQDVGEMIRQPELVVHDTRVRSQVENRGAGLSALAAIANQGNVIERQGDEKIFFDSSGLEYNERMLTRANEEGEPREFDSDVFNVACERQESTTISVHLKRECRVVNEDHVFESKAESRVRFRSRLACHEHDPLVACKTTMHAQETGLASVSGDIEYDADTAEQTEHSRSRSTTEWGVKGVAVEAGPLHFDTTGKVGIGAGPAKLTLELQLPVEGDHEHVPPELALVGREGTALHPAKLFDATLNSELRGEVESSINSSMSLIAETEIEHHLRLRGSTRVTPGNGEPCACGEARCTYCMCGFTLLLGTPLDEVEPGVTRTTSDPDQAFDLAWDPQTDEESSANGLVFVAGRKWALHRPDGDASGNWSAVELHG